MKMTDVKIDTPTARAKLTARRDPYYRMIEGGVALGYRRLVSGPGTWVTRRRVDGVYKIENLRTRDNRSVIANDEAPANGITILDFAQAQTLARDTVKTASLADGPGAELITVLAALDDYETDLKKRGGDTENADRVRVHLPATLAQILVAKLLARDFKEWDKALAAADLAASSINRVNSVFKAALNLAADKDERIVSRVWERALKTLPNAVESNNIVLREADVLGIVAASYHDSDEFGELVEVLAQTGARYSQAARLKPADLKVGATPRLMMPASKKGRGEKKIPARPVPIILDLALRLQRRHNSALLLTMPTGEPWRKSCHRRRFEAAVERYNETLPKAKRLPTQGDDAVTIYALRHTSIVRQLVANVPTRVVAVNHDTSVQMIEKHYSAYITDHTDELTRGALLDTARTDTSNVVALRSKR